MNVEEFHLELVQRLARLEQSVNNHLPTDVKRVETAVEKVEARINFLIVSIVVAIAIEIFRWLTR